MPKFAATLAASVSLIAISSAAYAEAVTAPPVYVTALRSSVPLDDIASSMTVITSEDIEQQNKPNVIELLREVPGMTVANNGAPGQTARVFMRGTNSNHVLVVLDGVIMNDPSDPGDAFDFSNLTTDNIERIEVLRGAQSTLYGSEAIGGVINIVTRQGRGKPTQTAFAEYGRYNTAKAGVGSSGEIGRTSYSFSASEGHTDGISAFDRKFGGHEKDSSDIYTLSANTASRLTDNFTAKLSARYNRNNTEFDSPGGFTRPADDFDPINDTRQVNVRAAGELSLYDGKWVQELGVSTLNLNRSQITEYFDSLGNPFFGRQQELGSRDKIDWVHHLKFIPYNVFTVGGELWSDHFKTLGTSEQNVDNRAVFADDQVTVGNFFANVGARVDDHQSFGDQFTWKVAPGYHIRPTGTTIKATYGTGFKAPSLSQLFDPNFGNTALHPEKSRGWDGGFEQEVWGDKVTFGSTFFRNDITQLIFNANTPPFAVINVGKARTEGVENVVTLRPLPVWTVNASHTYTLSENRSTGMELLRRPKHQVNVGSTWQYNAAGDVGANVHYVSSRRDIDFQFPFGGVYVKPYTTLDLNTNYKLNRTVTLYGRLDNVLDKRYEEVYAYGQPGMALYGGVKLSY